MLSKIGNSVVMLLCGGILGAFLGVYLFSSIHFMRTFTFYSLGILFLSIILNLLKLRNSSSHNKFLGFISSTIFNFVILSGIPGFIWLLVGESVDFDLIDGVIFALFFTFSVLGLAIVITLRMVWSDTRISQRIDQNLRGAKILLGMQETPSKQVQTTDGKNS